MKHNLVSTGITGLDGLLGGGYAKGSVILVTGNPGTGKTVFSRQFLYEGASQHHEKGVYVIFDEKPDDFKRNARAMGLDLESLERKRLIRLENCLAMRREGMNDVLAEIVQCIFKFKPQRLVIDSISAILQVIGFDETRIFLESIFGGFLKKQSITTLLVGEIPYGNNHTGFGVEDFVADGIIALGRTQDGFRNLRIRKMRASRVQQPNAFFTLNGGFQLLNRQALSPPIPKPALWKPIRDSETRFSSGSKDLDAILGGGFHKGTYVVLEADSNVSIHMIRLVELPLTWNFLSQRRGVLFLPALGADAGEIKSILSDHVAPDLFPNLMRVFERARRGEEETAPYVITTGNPNEFEKTEELLVETMLRLRQQTGQPVLRVIGFPALENMYAGRTELMFREIGSAIALNLRQGNLTLAIARPNPAVTRVLEMVDWHIKMIERDDHVLLRLVKPTPTPYYAVDPEVSEGNRRLRLTPML